MRELAKGWIVVDQHMKPLFEGALRVSNSSIKAWTSHYDGDAEEILTAQEQGCKAVFVTVNLCEKEMTKGNKNEEAKKKNQPIGEPDESFS